MANDTLTQKLEDFFSSVTPPSFDEKEIEREFRNWTVTDIDEEISRLEGLSANRPYTDEEDALLWRLIIEDMRRAELD